MNVYTALRMADDLSSRMLDALHILAKNPQGALARRNLGNGGGTHGALYRRGLLGEGVDERGQSGYFLTPKAWAFLRAQYRTVRPADAGRLTVDEALAEAYPAEQAEQTAPAPRSGGVVIPGALADYLTADPPLDLDTRDALDDARRGRGRTLVIKPKTIAVLHVISRNTEYLLASAYTTEPQKRAARQWLATAGRAPQVVTTRYASTREAYDAAMSSDTVRNGDVLVVEAEAAVAFLWKSHPVAVTTAHGEFHRAEGDPREVDANTGPAVRMAMDVAHQIGAYLARAEDQAEAEQALAEAAAADAPEATPAVDLEALAVAVACPMCHAPAGARCTTHASKPAREPHGRRFEAVEDAAGITEHRAAARREAEARGGWVVALDRKAEDALSTAYAARVNAATEARLDQVEAEVATVEDAEALYAAALVTEADATDGTWRGAWIGEQQAADVLFVVDQAEEQGALSDDRAAQ
ncbi:zinc finger domain-containing protein [Streptomyces sp. bgisy027]|uniref:zinc finger domain-containing protein n=1 Tax=Streptomyces sp. bgisy027 TaxID=3413770 RepID=UPI003D70B4B5